MGGETKGRVGKHYRDNVIDSLLEFNRPQTWTTTGVGAASLDTDLFFQGSGSLKLLNSDPENDLLASNSSQSTIIAMASDYRYSFYMLKSEVDEFMTLEVTLFQNAVPYAQTYVLGSETTDLDVNDKFIRFTSDDNYSFSKGDDITFTFNLKGKSGTSLVSTSVWIDGVQLEAVKTDNVMPSEYSKSINPKPVKATSFSLSSLNTAPSSASDTGTEGEIRFDADYIYVCTATDTWKRVAIATW